MAALSRGCKPRIIYFDLQVSVSLSFAFNELCSECSLSTKNFGVSAAKETNNVSVQNNNQAVNEFSASTFHKPFELLRSP